MRNSVGMWDSIPDAPNTTPEENPVSRILTIFLALLAWAGIALAAIDINTASEAELDKIKGVGPVKAKAIAAERKKNGPFKSLDEVATRVKGIGPKTVADWKKSGAVTAGSAPPGTAPAAAPPITPSAPPPPPATK